MKIKQKLAMSGHFKVEVIRPDGTVRLAAPWQENLITNIGLDYIRGWDENTENKNRFSMTEYLAVGSGSNPPDPTDTALQVEVAASNTAVSLQGPNSTTPPYYASCRRTFTFAVGVAAGNLTELGLTQEKPRGTPDPLTKRFLFSRALIKNEAGMPITVTVLPDEILQVTYELRAYLVDTSDHKYTINDGATPIEITVRPYRVGLGGVNNWWSMSSQGEMSKIEDYLWGPQWKKGPQAIQPAFNANVNSPGDSIPSESSTAYRGWGNIRQPIGSRKNVTWMDLRIERGAHSDIRYVHTMSSPTFNWSLGFNPAINKPIDETLRFEFENSWGRYEP